MRVCLRTVPYHEHVPYLSYEHLRCLLICSPIIPSFWDYSPSRSLWIIITEYGLCQEEWLWVGMGPRLGPLNRHEYCVCLLGHGTFVDWVLWIGCCGFGCPVAAVTEAIPHCLGYLFFFWQDRVIPWKSSHMGLFFFFFSFLEKKKQQNK